jgi:hypothetical protein
MTETVYVATKTGISGNHADPVYGAAVPVKCRLDKKRNTLKDDTGNERQTTHVITTETEITAGQIVWLDAANKDNLSNGSALEEFQIKSSQLPNGNLRLWEVQV